MNILTEVTLVDSVSHDLRTAIPSTILEGHYRKALNNASKKTSLKGFRAGKTPLKMVEKLYGDDLLKREAFNLAYQAMNEEVSKRNLRLAAPLKITDEIVGLGQDSIFTARAFTFPIIEVKNYRGMTIEMNRREVTDKEIDEAIDDILKRYPTLVPDESKSCVEFGDTVAIRMGNTPESISEKQKRSKRIERRTKSASFKRSALSGSISEDEADYKVSDSMEFTTIIGSGALSQNVVDQVLGMRSGESKKVHLQPLNGPKGPSQEFTITVLGIGTASFPELDDHFAQRVDPNTKTFSDLREKIKEDLEQKVQEEQQGEIRHRIGTKLLSEHQFDVPIPLIERELSQILKNANIAEIGMIPAESRPNLIKSAADRVRIVLICEAIADVESIQPSIQELGYTIIEIAESLNIPITYLERKLASEPEMLVQLKAVARHQKTYEFLEAQAVIEFKASEDERVDTSKNPPAYSAKFEAGQTPNEATSEVLGAESIG